VIKLFEELYEIICQIIGKNNVYLPKDRFVNFVCKTPQTEIIDWGLRMISIPDIWKQTKGEGITVAVLDTGYSDHKDLKGAIIKKKDFTNTGVNDKEGHSTHCIGIIGARQNKIGVIGVAPECRIISGKVLGNDGSGRIKWIIEGIKWAIEEEVDIISMSLGSAFPHPKLKRTIKEAIKKGIIVVCAAGNSGKKKNQNTIDYPAKYKETIAIGSYNNEGKRSDFSSVGDEIDVLCPGENIFSTYKNNSYVSMSGTSMATPIAAGVLALAIAKHRKYGGNTPLQNQEQARQHLIKMASRDINMERSEYGYGILNPKQIKKLFK